MNELCIAPAIELGKTGYGKASKKRMNVIRKITLLKGDSDDNGENRSNAMRLEDEYLPA